MKIMISFCLVVIFSTLLVSCGIQHTPKTPTVLSDIAYDKNSSEDCTVYLLENKVYVPYLVITNNYYGNCLLIRKNCLDTPMEYNPADIITPSYYENCKIDMFLNTDYKKRLSEYINASLIDVDLIITSQNSIGRCGDELTTIRRKIFLLSLEEFGLSDGRILLAEGNELEYFRDKKRRVASTDSGTLCQWYLRTPNTWDADVISYIDVDGTYGTTGILTIKGETMNYIRPALCLAKNTKIHQIIIDEHSVYAIE